MGRFTSRLLDLDTRTESDQGALVDTLPMPDSGDDARFYLNVTAATGTLDVTIVATIAGVDFVVGTFTQATGVVKQTITVLSCPEMVKAVYAIGGATPSFTFEVFGSR